MNKIKNNGRKPLSVDKGRKPNVSIDNRQITNQELKKFSGHSDLTFE